MSPNSMLTATYGKNILSPNRSREEEELRKSKQSFRFLHFYTKLSRFDKSMGGLVGLCVKASIDLWLKWGDTEELLFLFWKMFGTIVVVKDSHNKKFSNRK